MATTGRPSTGDREADLGSPQSPALIRKNVRKRVNPVNTTNPASVASPYRGINTRLIYNEYKPKGPTSTGIKIRNFFAFLLVLSLPACIFVLPIWRRPSPERPRLVIAVRTTTERLNGISFPLILDRLLSEQPNSLLVILPSFSNDNNAALPTLPSHLQKYLDDTPMKVVHTRPEYGATITSSMITVLLEEEQQGQEGNDSQDQDNLGETRILLLDDRYPLPSVSSLVESSLNYPDAVLSPVGGNWRSYFRQIKWVLEPNSPLNQFPNVVLHTVKVSSTVDLLDSSRGIIFRAGLLIPHLAVFMERFKHLIDKATSHHTLDPIMLHVEAEDVLCNALLESLSIARRVVPWVSPQDDDKSRENNATNSKHLLMTPVFSRQHWMTTALQLQEEWNIWNEYSFWDWDKFTPQQLAAIDCESRFPPDCPNHNNYRRGGASYCRPNPQHCGEFSEYEQVWNTLVQSG